MEGPSSIRIRQGLPFRTESRGLTAVSVPEREAARLSARFKVLWALAPGLVSGMRARPRLPLLPD